MSKPLKVMEILRGNLERANMGVFGRRPGSVVLEDRIRKVKGEKTARTLRKRRKKQTEDRKGEF